MSLCCHPSDLCYIIYTSGTSGLPKGVMIEHRNVVRLFFNDNFQFDFNEDDTWTMFHSQCFDFSVWEIYGALLFGGKLIIVPKMVSRDADAFGKVLLNEQVTVLNQTPSAFYSLIQNGGLYEQKLAHLRYIIFGGEALSPGKIGIWKTHHPDVRLINMYGITETTVHVTYKEIGDYEIANNISNIGRPIPTLSVFVFDKKMRLVPKGVTGELYVGGLGVARGYINNVLLSGEKFVSDPYKVGGRLYRTGDLARWLPDGNLEYIGRIDDQVKIRGFRIELGEIEVQLGGFEAIRECVVVALGDQGSKYLVAYYTGPSVSGNGVLRDYLSSRLPDYMVPSYFVRLDHFPLTPNGKLDKKALPAPDLITEDVYVSPRTPAEQLLSGIWSKVLGIDHIGITDNFFALGGDSIKSIQISSRIRNAGYAITVKDILVSQSIEKLAPLLQVLTAGSDQSSVTGTVPFGPYPGMVFCGRRC